MSKMLEVGSEERAARVCDKLHEIFAELEDLIGMVDREADSEEQAVAFRRAIASICGSITIDDLARKCHCPALRGLVYCFHHQKIHVARNRSKYSHNRLALASIESREGVQLAIAQVCDALGKARIDERKAGVMMRGLQLATQLVRMRPEADPSQVVPGAYIDADGFLTAPEIPIDQDPNSSSR